MNTEPLDLLDKDLLNNTLYRDPQKEFPPFEVTYFVAYFRHNSTLQYHINLPNEDLITLGLCLPASCSISELSLILERIFRDRVFLINDLYSMDFKLIEVKDVRDDYQWLLSGTIPLICVVLGLTISVMIIGTIYDIFVYQKYLNAKNKITKINNKAWTLRAAKGLAVQTLTNANISVDTYFFISGFLVAYLFLKNVMGKERIGSINYRAKINEFFVYVIRRFIRYFYTAALMLGAILIGSIVLTGYISYIYEYVPILSEQYRLIDVLYYPPWVRIGPYLIGIIAAYILIKLNKRMTMKKVKYDLYYLCIIKQVLSFKVWIPFSRLTYCAYLLNPFIIHSIRLHNETSAHLEFLSMPYFWDKLQLATYALMRCP
ncbi:nose resistant to fluoxetine protein 6 [Lasius niger]|uniref:Nose resistant to fluoxetine protein 6 n=1 Tax=Lasius niger TaxID=67767 RepID=A0A0J7L6X1_LASNI|nr:nose resistant to fluoxetine protein 6 [Lasius niger]